MKTEALEVLKNRRSIRSFTSEQVSRDLLDRVLEAGSYAPTAMGRQSPVIVAVQNPAKVAQLDAMNARVLGVEGKQHPYYGAPTILLVLVPADVPTGVEDASLVAGNLLNAAYAVGLGGCWIHRAKEMFEMPEGKALLKEWGLPENLRGVASVALGHPAGEHPAAAPRKEGYIHVIE